VVPEAAARRIRPSAGELAVFYLNGGVSRRIMLSALLAEVRGGARDSRADTILGILYLNGLGREPELSEGQAYFRWLQNMAIRPPMVKPGTCRRRAGARRRN